MHQSFPQLDDADADRDTSCRLWSYFACWCSCECHGRGADGRSRQKSELGRDDQTSTVAATIPRQQENNTLSQQIRDQRRSAATQRVTATRRLGVQLRKSRTSCSKLAAEEVELSRSRSSSNSKARGEGQERRQTIAPLEKAANTNKITTGGEALVQDIEQKLLEQERRSQTRGRQDPNRTVHQRRRREKSRNWTDYSKLPTQTRENLAILTDEHAHSERQSHRCERRQLRRRKTPTVHQVSPRDYFEKQAKDSANDNGALATESKVLLVPIENRTQTKPTHKNKVRGEGQERRQTIDQKLAGARERSRNEIARICSHDAPA